MKKLIYILLTLSVFLTACSDSTMDSVNDAVGGIKNDIGPVVDKLAEKAKPILDDLFSALDKSTDTLLSELSKSDSKELKEAVDKVIELKDKTNTPEFKEAMKKLQSVLIKQADKYTSEETLNTINSLLKVITQYLNIAG